MFSFSSLNKVAYKTKPVEDVEYIKLSELELGKVYKVFALYLHTGKYGVQASALIDNGQRIVNLPNSKVSEIESLNQNEDAVNAINAGACGLKTYEYHSSKYNKNFVSFDWVDMLEAAPEQSQEQDLPF